MGGYYTDHHVTFVGYGKYKNKWVWVIKNSYGSSWGDNGFFYMPIGHDSYCIEHFIGVVRSRY